MAVQRPIFLDTSTQELTRFASSDTPLGAITGDTGENDNAILRADGTGGITLQDSPLFISDAGWISGDGADNGITVDANGTVIIRPTAGFPALTILNSDGSGSNFNFNPSGPTAAAADNCFIGNAAGISITTGDSNQAIGQDALSSATVATDNIAVGASALVGLIDGTSNIALGARSLSGLTSGSAQNIGIGNRTSSSIITGSSNVSIGNRAGAGNYYGDNNVVLGSYAGSYSYANYNCTCVGYAARTPYSTGAIAIGSGVQQTGDDLLSIGNTIFGHLVNGDIAIRKGVTPTSFAVHNTFTSSTSFESLIVDWTSNVARVETRKGASGGTARDLVLGRDSIEHIRLSVTETVVNDTGVDQDFRVEGDTATSLFVCDAGLEAVQIGTTTPGAIADFRPARSTINNIFSLGVAAELTIATGAITITRSSHRIDTEGDASTDDLDIINGGSEGDVLILRAENDARTVVVRDASSSGGNINLAANGNFSLTHSHDRLLLHFDGTSWIMLSSANNEI